MAHLAKLKKCYPAHQFLKSLKDRGFAVEDNELQKQIEQSLKDLAANSQNSLTQGEARAANRARMGPPSQGQGVNPTNTTNPNYNDNTAQDPLRRFQMTYRTEPEGQWTFFNEGRHYASNLWTTPIPARRPRRPSL